MKVTMRQSVLFDSPAVRYGLRFGIALAVLGSGEGLTLEVLNKDTIINIAVMPCSIFAIFIFWVLGEAGHWTAERTGTIGSGTLAGAIAGGFGGVATSVVFYAAKFFLQPPRVPSNTFAFTHLITIMAEIVQDVSIFAGLGAACGAFGAGIGKSKYDKRQAAASSPTPPPHAPTSA